VKYTEPTEELFHGRLVIPAEIFKFQSILIGSASTLDLTGNTGQGTIGQRERETDQIPWFQTRQWDISPTSTLTDIQDHTGQTSTSGLK
jgi:hypothetical protein